MGQQFKNARSLRPFGYRPLLVQRRRWYDGSEQEGEGSQPTDTGTPPGKSGGDSGGNSSQPTQTLTQDEANRLIGEARRKGRESAVADLLKDLGFEKADDLKALVTDARKRQEADMTEAEKAKAAKEAAEKERDELKARLEAAERQRLTDRRDAAIRSALTSAGVKSLDKTFAVLASLKSKDIGAVLKDDGTVDDAKVRALVDGAKKDYPEDFKTGGAGSPSLSGGRVTGSPPPKIRTSGSI